jgi:HEAT repeat protein
MVQKKSFEEQLAILADDDQSLNVRLLKAFSNLLPEQQYQFENAWNTFSVERRREVETAMVELAEEDVEQDYNLLFLFMLRDEDEEVRETAIEGLWEYEERDFLKELLRLVESDPSEKVREKATIGLSRFALLAELGKLPARWKTQVQDTLLALSANSSNPLNVRRRAVEGLGYFSNDERVQEFITRSYHSDDELIKASALVAMGRTVDKRWIPEIGKELSNESPALRYEAARAAGELGSLELVTPLIELTRDHDPEVRLASIWALGQVGGQEASRTLKALSNSESETVREAAKEALSEIAYSKNPLNVLGI